MERLEEYTKLLSLKTKAHNARINTIRYSIFNIRYSIRDGAASILSGKFPRGPVLWTFMKQSIMSAIYL